jgi:hypothetical protein
VPVPQKRSSRPPPYLTRRAHVPPPSPSPLPNPNPTTNSCDGTWGLVVLSPKEPDELVVACNGSPMVLGIGEGRVFIASETTAFNRHTKNFIALKVRSVYVRVWFFICFILFWDAACAVVPLI